MTEELQDLGLSVGHRRVGRLMRENNIKTIRTHKYKVEEGLEIIRGIISPTTD
jgi:transposase InsO family protein